MKKLFLALVAMVMAVSANAFEFDGIELNGNVVEITRQISAKGYVYDDTKDCLKGNCQGTTIYLTINYADVKQKNKVGQLIIDVPMKDANALAVITQTFNVVYHQISSAAGVTTYQVSTDGTTVAVSKQDGNIRLAYSTPYYKAPEK